MVIISSCSDSSDANEKEDDTVMEEVIDANEKEDDPFMEEEIIDTLAVTNAQASSSNSQEDTLHETNAAHEMSLQNIPDTPVVYSDALFVLPSCSNEIKPAKGMTFDDLETGLNFYKEYAKVCGFISRLDSTKAVKGIITHKRCVCNKEGKSKHEGTKRKRAVTRIGCGASVNFKRLESGEYEIYEFIEAHSHAMATPSTMIHLKPSRDLNLVHKKMIMDNSRVNHGPVLTFRQFKEYVKGYKNVGASLEDFKKISRDVKKFIKEYDAQMLIEDLMQRKAMSPSFYFDFDVDEEKKLNKVFWVDPISIKNYALFGDAVSFDATYDFNQYKMVFTPFTGVDNHKRCVTFAAGLVRKENAESFTWLFQNFLKAMGNCYPITIITDQCRGIKKAVRDVFGDKTHHRFCMWHIMKKLPDKVGSSICQDTNFLKEINSVVWDVEITPEEFESKWNSIISSYELSEHEWLNKMFRKRERWIPAYFRDIYLGGILRTTSRSESENSFFGNFTNPHVSLIEFLMRFRSALDAQRWKYSKVTADDKYSSPKLSTPLPLEKKASEFYTSTVFYDFQEEIQAACFTCGLSPNMAEDHNKHISILDREKDKIYRVDLNDNKFSCSCKMFERIGLLCRHVVWVLKDKGFDDIPREYLLDRWGKSATCRPIFNVAGTSLLDDCASIESRKNNISELWSEVFTSVSLVEPNEEQTDELLQILRAFNEKLLISAKRGKSKNKKAEIEMLLGAKIPTEVTVLPPEMCKNKGSGRRIMSNKEKAVQENSKPLRKCRACGEMTHHDSRNCPSRVNNK